MHKLALLVFAMFFSGAVFATGEACYDDSQCYAGEYCYMHQCRKGFPIQMVERLNLAAVVHQPLSSCQSAEPSKPMLEATCAAALESN